MSAWLFFVTWYNLPFTFLLGICVVLSGLQLVGLGGQHEGDTDLDHSVDVDSGVELDHGLDLGHDLGHDLDHDIGEAGQDLDHDFDHDLDHDVGHDVDHAIDHNTDHDVGHDVGHDVAHEAGGFSPLSVLAFIGVGKAPLLVVLLILFGSMGILGWLLNGVVVSLLGGHYPDVAFMGVLLAVLFLGVSVSSRSARLIAQALPPFVSSASRATALIGRSGTVISPTVDGTYGQVHLRDQGGTLITVFAVTQAEAPIARGEAVVVVSYDSEQRRYVVTRSKQISPYSTGL